MDVLDANQSVAHLDAIQRADIQRGYQIASLITPPAYIAFALIRKRPLSINRALRATWVSGAVGAAGGAGYAWFEAQNSPVWLRDRHEAIAYDLNRIKADDHSTIGAVLFAALTPALFWKRARVVHLVLGGAGVGSSVGFLTHLYRSFSEGQAKNSSPSLSSRSGSSS